MIVIPSGSRVVLRTVGIQGAPGDLTFPESVTTALLANGSVTTPKLADEAVTTAKLAPNSVTQGKIGENAVGASEIVSGAISDDEINVNAAIAPSKIAGTAVVTNDARLSDARTPTAHKATHATGGSDALTPADIGAATSAQGAKADTALQVTGTPSNGQVPQWSGTGAVWAGASQRPNIVFQGDSLSAQAAPGESATPIGPNMYGTTMPYYAIAGINLDAKVRSFASLGKQVGAFAPATPTGMNAEGAAIDAELVTGANNVCVLLGGTNDLSLGGQTAAVVYDRIVAFCSARKAAGWKVIVCTLLPRTDGSAPANFETSRTTINTNIRDNFATFADAVADLAADPIIGGATASNNANYYLDNLHPSQAGRQRMGRIVGAALASLGVPLANLGGFDSALTTANAGQGGVGIGPGSNSNGRALGAVTSGNHNTALGTSAASSLTTGSANTAVGFLALNGPSTVNNNTAVGWYALLSASGSNNTAVGASAGQSPSGANNLTAVGYEAAKTATGTGTTAVGNAALEKATGINNVGMGVQAGQNITTGSYNLAAGTLALGTGPCTGSENTAVGYSTLRFLTSGNYNVAIGGNAGALPAGQTGRGTTTGARNVMIGYQTGQGSSTQRNDLVLLGHNALGDADKAVSVGANANAAHASSVALGADTTTTAANQVMVGARDIEVTNSAMGIILRSPDGTRYRLTVANGGTVSVAAV